MDSWYLKDASGGVVGPISREVVIDLLRSRPGVFVSASADGVHFSPVRTPQVQSMVPAEAPATRAQREAVAERRVLEQLQRLRSLEPHALFGVPQKAPLKDYREGYYRIYARYRVENLPPDVSGSLKAAHEAVCAHLRSVMQAVEKALTPVAPVPGGPREWKLADLHLQQLPSGYRGDVEVTPATALIFSTHKLINLKNEGVFFPCLPTLSLGTRLDLTFRFKDAHREVRTRGAVALESAQASSLSPLRGFGVRLENLSVEDRGFMLREATRLGAAAPR